MTRPSRRDLEERLVAYSHRLHRAGWVANHDGNISARLLTDRFLATPTSLSKAAVSRDSLIMVDGDGRVHAGTHKPFSELALHLAVYRRRPDVAVVMHAHPPTATGFAVAGVQVLSTMLAESVVSLGAVIPLVPYARPKTPEFATATLPYLDDADAVLLERHGVLTVGPDLETAYLRMELVEHLAKIQLAAHQSGHVRELDDAEVAALLKARAPLASVVKEEGKRLLGRASG